MMKAIKASRKMVWVFPLMGWMQGQAAWAADPVGTSANFINFRGAVVETIPCIINNGQLIQLDFGQGIVIRNLDGQRYSQTIDYDIQCGDSGVVRLSVIGTSTQFDGAAVQTDVPGLGIRLNRGGQPFTLNSPVVINPASPPVLTAVPVADPGQAPSPGAFHAAATLLADYQ
ncbi:fimbrial protein [Aeromonas hydrophila]|uniref:fimbrial protein n=1 Tax=Aeromonas hydrophila TaxID=644 RepID=UPI0009564C1E|nr:fimbrial protein [Aeromonas hydrophila]SIR20466.1 Pilin (type 1 fimbria component protein) [Aeromonas hydrophila]SIR36915.1 Pilin (type 1 fimbria component protein) [Aeromonas hydrophila]